MYVKLTCSLLKGSRLLCKCRRKYHSLSIWYRYADYRM